MTNREFMDRADWPQSVYRTREERARPGQQGVGIALYCQSLIDSAGQGAEGTTTAKKFKLFRKGEPTGGRGGFLIKYCVRVHGGGGGSVRYPNIMVKTRRRERTRLPALPPPL